MSKKAMIIQWAFTAFILSGVLVYGFSMTSLFFLLSALVLAPIPPIRKALKALNIGTAVVIALSVVLFVVGAFCAPREKTETNFGDDSHEEVTAEFSFGLNKKTKETQETAETKKPAVKKTEEKTERKTEDRKTEETEDDKKAEWFPFGEKTESESSLPSASQAYSEIPAYSGEIVVILNDNTPSFTSAELTTTAYEKYSNLDSLGRCGMAIASCGKEIMPAEGEKRGSISHVYPSGWVQAKYDGVSGGYLYNRCHLLGWQLSAENDNKKNLITGTRSFNVDGMLPFENMIADYIKETGNHVAYRVTPVYEGKNLVATGVRMEAYSIEDQGDGICFHVFVYNVQAGITIDYATGKSAKTDAPTTTTPPATTPPPTTATPAPTVAPPTTTKAPVTTSPPIVTHAPSSQTVYVTQTGKKYHCTTGCPGLSNAKAIYEATLSEALSRGLRACSKCY